MVRMVCVSTRTHATCTENQLQLSAISHQPISHQPFQVNHLFERKNKELKENLLTVGTDSAKATGLKVKNNPKINIVWRCVCIRLLQSGGTGVLA